MLDSPHTSVSALLRTRMPGYTLPAGLYTRPEVFEADMEAIFHRQWLLVGVEADVPEAGDVYVVDIGRSSILILRDDDEVVRAFHNVCRHRGARLLDAGKHTVGKLVCPYHQWTYELTGDLSMAPHMGEAFDKSCHDLRSVLLTSVGGLLFACLAEQPPADFADLAEAMEPRFAPYDLANTKVAYETSIVEQGNWKLTMENNRECYHCESNHPELCISYIALDFGYDPAELSPEQLAEAHGHERLYAEKTAEWEADGFPSAAIEHLAGHDTNFRSQRMVIAGGGQSQTMDGLVACKRLLGDVERTDLGDLHMWTHHSWIHVMPDHAVIITATPISPDETRVHSKWLVHKDAVEGFDYDVDRLIEVWKMTNAQDAHLVGIAHAGAKSAGYVPGPYSRFTENQLDSFSTWYVERMQAFGY